MPPLDDTANQKFTLTVDGVEAKLEYRASPGRLDLTHTVVPEALGGRGIAAQLVAAAVERAAKSGETIVPSCSYVRGWLTKHPEEAARVSIDWD